MVKAPLYSGEDSVLMIGGINSSCTIEEYSNGGWSRKSHCAVGGVIGFRKVFTSQSKSFLSIIASFNENEFFKREY